VRLAAQETVLKQWGILFSVVGDSCHEECEETNVSSAAVQREGFGFRVFVRH
jgi:hypothetical protein